MGSAREQAFMSISSRENLAWLPIVAAVCFVHPLVARDNHPGDPRFTVNLNEGWSFSASGTTDLISGALSGTCETVSLPHTHSLFSPNLDGFERTGRQIGWYKRELLLASELKGRRFFLEFRGAMGLTTVWINSKKVGENAVGGYDSFSFDITPFAHIGTNTVLVCVDNTSHREIPPDGVEHDYMLFGGLYRDVFLHVTDALHLTFPWESPHAGVRITLPKCTEEETVIESEATVRNDSATKRDCVLVTEVHDRRGSIVAQMKSEIVLEPGAEFTFVQASPPLEKPQLWSPDAPYLYKVQTRVIDEQTEVDSITTAIGLRSVNFDKERGFSLNGHPLKLVGVNRHQTWPFIGNAVPKGLQRRDAEQIKAMGVNWVRLSHYPQDPEFLNALDELGLMALEEPATWMSKGPGKWMENLEKSFRSMIRRDRNHPSIIIWGTYINHGGAEPALVKAAIEEDPTRDRAQDTVPTPMNFLPGFVSGDGALSIEHTGHIFPTARGSREMAYRVDDGGKGKVLTFANREYEQAKRHWEQLDAAYKKPDNAGLAVWCMYDYNTEHNINENGLVWHGVCDLFRIPKYSYFWHQSELTIKPMAYVVRIDSTHAAVFSNCERVRLSSNEGLGYHEIATQKPDETYVAPNGQKAVFALHHPPFHFAVPSTATALKAEGLSGDTITAVYEWKQFGTPVALTLEADRPEIIADGADLSRIIVTAVDTNGTPVDTCRSQVQFQIEGYGQLIGENPVRLRAGKMIILAQSGYVPGELTITASSQGLAPSQVKVKMSRVPGNYDIPPDLTAKQPTSRKLVVDPTPLRNRLTRQ